MVVTIYNEEGFIGEVIKVSSIVAITFFDRAITFYLSSGNSIDFHIRPSSSFDAYIELEGKRYTPSKDDAQRFIEHISKLL